MSSNPSSAWRRLPGCGQASTPGSGELEIEAADCKAGYLAISRSDLRVIGVKSHRSEGPISLADEEIGFLRDHRRQQAALRLQAGTAWEDRGLVFTDDRGPAT